MIEITTMGALIVTAVGIVLATILLVITATKVFSRSHSKASTIIPDKSSSIITTSSSSSRSWKYDVFLSFRGEDTRKTFVDHLYFALEQHGILTYKDDVTLDRGDTIGPSLLKAIEESEIALVIFSEHFADSSWCLDELSCIMKCHQEKRGQIVMPIFYNVDPSDVSDQISQFGKAFAKHKNNNNKVVSWKKALVDASNMAGWEPKHVANG
uniref:disease resistance protein RUN1-like n=1 Tax=Erigeron canadensis TaxID=72917 RepID=UPI001CB9096A|nr:disease resistance protein RUN1-like [Erigeron canadensis]